jgi:hypothetical protein
MASPLLLQGKLGSFNAAQMLLAALRHPEYRGIFSAALVGRSGNTGLSGRELVDHLSQRDLVKKLEFSMDCSVCSALQ